MPKTINSFILILLTSILLSACSTLRIDTTAYLSPSLTNTLPKDGKYFVSTSPVNPNNQLLHNEVKRKTEKLVSSKGYNLVSTLDEADWLIAFDFGLANTKTSTGAIPITTSQTSSFSTFNSDGTLTFGTYTQPSTTYYPYSETSYSHYLNAYVIDILASRKKDETIIAWQGDSFSSGNSSDLRLVLDFLLVTTFEHFGTDTKKQLKRTMSLNDPQVIELQNSITGN